jgi:CheY-like chemotaxis protein
MESRTDQQSARRWILVVDGDAQTQRILDLSLRSAGFEVKTASNAAEALAAIADHEPSLVVSDTQLGDGIDGFQLCRSIKERPDRAGVPFLFLAELTTESKMRGVEAGADDFLGKPLYLQEVVARARALLQRRERERLEALADGNTPFNGDLADIPLVDLLRAVQAHRKSGVAHLHGPGAARGEIYFRHGAAIDGEVGRLSGRDAVYRLLSWGSGRFEVEWKSIRRKDAVEMEPEALLVESLRRQDEWRRLLIDAPPLDTVFEADYRLLADRLAEIPDEVNSILRLFDGTRTFFRVVDECGLGDLEALAVIGKLYREGIIRELPAKRDPRDAPRADAEAWLPEATGPFRPPPGLVRRDLFAPPPEPGSGVHARPTAPVDPLEERPAAVADDMRARFTDRLNTDTPAAAPQRLPPAGPPPVTTPAREAALLQAETTLQGFAIQPHPRPTTSPGFAAAAVPAPAARNLPDVTPPMRTPPAAAPPAPPGPGGGDGIPEPVVPQEGEPAILVPLAGEPAQLDAPVTSEEQRPVAGEILARTPSPKTHESRAAAERLTQLRESAAVPLRATDPGLGPPEPTDGALILSTETEPPIRLTAPRLGPPGIDASADLDADVPTAEALSEREVSEEIGVPPRTRGPVLVSVLLGMLIAFGGGWLILRSGWRATPAPPVAVDPAQVTAAAAAPPVSAPPAVPATGDRVPEGPAVASPPSTTAPHAAPTGPSVPPRVEPAVHAGGAVTKPALVASHRSEPASPVVPPPAELDERAADPKMAREAPAAFQQLLTACRSSFAEKRMKDAEATCGAARDANPESAEACALLAHALFNRNHRRDALMWAERAVKIDPRQADAYVIIGGVHQNAGEKTEAKAAYRKYLELAPSGTYAPDLRAIVDSL